MAISRAAVIKAMDAGRWLTVDNTYLGVRGDTVDDSSDASRYTNLAVLDALIPTTNWFPNQWGDESKTLIDAAYGYAIKDKFFSDSPGSVAFGASPTPNVAGGQKSSNVLDRTAVLFSYDVGAYVFINNPLDSPAAWEVFFTSDPWAATRFDNLADVSTWLNNTIWGEVPNGYAIEQYSFTKAPGLSQIFQGSPSYLGTKSIFRAYVPYSNQEGAYLRINNPGDPIANMTFTYVGNPWEGARFQNLNDFKDIVDQRPDFFGTSFKAGWEVPQFFFTQSTKTPKGNPFQDFFTDNPCVQSKYDGKYANTYQHIVATAGELCYDWRKFYDYMWNGVFLGNMWGFADFECFQNWFKKQDHRELENWLYKLWSKTACGEIGGGEFAEG